MMAQAPLRGTAPAVELMKLNSQFTAIVQTICLIMIVALLAFAWVSPARVEEGHAGNHR